MPDGVYAVVEMDTDGEVSNAWLFSDELSALRAINNNTYKTCTLKCTYVASGANLFQVARINNRNSTWG